MNDILSAMNVTLGMPAINAGGMADTVIPDGGVSFGDVLGQAVNTADEVVSAEGNVNDAVLEEDKVTDGEKVTFAELTRNFAEKMSNADESVINAAVQLVMSVGRVVEKLFGVESGSVAYDMEESPESVMQIFGVLIDKIPEKSEVLEEDINEDGAEIIEEEIITDDAEILSEDTEMLPKDTVPEIAVTGKNEAYIPEEFTISFPDDREAEVLIEDIADVIDEGVSENKETGEIVKVLKEILSENDNDRKSALADAVVTVLCALSGISPDDVSVEIAAADNRITPEAAERFSGIAKAIASDMPAVRKNDAVIRIAVQADIPKDAVKFAEFMQKPERVSFVHMAKNFGGMHGLRINNASAQADEINGNKNIPFIPERADIPAADIPVFTADNIPVPETEIQIFRELGEYVNIQLGERISEEISVSDTFNGVKELTVVLKPEHLGEVAVKIASDTEGKVSVVLSAANAEVGRAISENAAALSEGLARQNIEVNDIIVVNPSEASAYMSLDFTNQGFDRGDYSEDTSGGESYGGRGRRNAVEGISSDISTADAARAAKLLKEAKLWTTA